MGGRGSSSGGAGKSLLGGLGSDERLVIADAVTELFSRKRK